MSILKLPTELLLEIADYSSISTHKALTETHPVLSKALQGQLHKRALALKPRCV